MEYEIEKNVSMPERGKHIYPFAKMKVGDSINIIGEKQYRNARAAASAFGKYHGKKFATRRTSNGCRLWRVS